MQTRGPVRDYARYAVSASSIRLRPLSSAEMLENAQYLYRSFGFELLKRALSGTLIGFSGLVFVFGFLIQRASQNVFGTSMQSQIAESVLVLVGGLACAVPLLTAGLSMTMTTTTLVVHRWIRGEAIDWEEVDRLQFSNFWRGFWSLTYGVMAALTWVLVGLGVSALGGAMMIPLGTDHTAPNVVVFFGVVFALFAVLFAILRFTRVCLCVPIGLVEDLPAKKIYARSVVLTEIRSGKDTSIPIGSALGLMLLIILVLYGAFATVGSLLSLEEKLIGSISSPVLQSFGQAILKLLPGFLALWVTLPYFALVLSIGYFERRARKEGYDLEVLASQLGSRRS